MKSKYITIFFFFLLIFNINYLNNQNNTITVNRINQKEAELSIKSEKYYIENSLIKPVELKTTKEDFLSAFSATNGNLNLECSNETNYVGTSCKLQTKSDTTTTSENQIVVYGDVTGDGQSTITDIVKTIMYAEKQTGLETDADKEAANIDYDETISINDAVSMADHHMQDIKIPLPTDEKLETIIELSTTNIRLEKNSSEKINATTNKGDVTILDWKSSDEKIATVDSTGLVTGVSEGNTTITVTATDGTSKSLEVNVFVIVPVTGVTLNKDELSLELEESESLIATISPINATNKNVTWRSSNDEVATVSNGTVKAVGNGTATITVTTLDGGQTAKCKVTVGGIYDVILFWGQSNMSGSAGHYKTDSSYCNGNTGEDKIDARIEEKGGIAEFAKLTGINEEIINRYDQLGHVRVPVKVGTAYDYRYCDSTNDDCTSNSYASGKEALVAITENTTTIGQYLYNDDGKIVKQGVGGITGARYHSTNSSTGTNITPWFAYEYNKKTGHKVIIVMGANNGERLNHFLPHGSSNCNDTISTTCTSYSKYIYETMTIKYKAAIKYLESNGYVIGNKFHILFQGEQDAASSDENTTTKEAWVNMYKTIYDNLEKDLGMNFGVIIESSRRVGDSYYDGVQRIHEAQEEIINDKSDKYNVILGSAYSYNRYVPDKTNYDTSMNGTYLGEKKSYEEALEQAKLSFSITDCDIKNNSIDNSIHLNSAALSQIGLETANNVYNYLKQ